MSKLQTVNPRSWKSQRRAMLVCSFYWLTARCCYYIYVVWSMVKCSRMEGPEKVSHVNKRASVHIIKYENRNDFFNFFWFSKLKAISFQLGAFIPSTCNHGLLQLVHFLSNISLRSLNNTANVLLITSLRRCYASGVHSDYRPLSCKNWQLLVEENQFCTWSSSRQHRLNESANIFLHGKVWSIVWSVAILAIWFELIRELHAIKSVEKKYKLRIYLMPLPVSKAD